MYDNATAIASLLVLCTVLITFIWKVWKGIVDDKISISIKNNNDTKSIENMKLLIEGHKAEIEGLRKELSTLKDRFHKGDIRYTEVVAAIDVMSKSLNELEGDFKGLLNIILEKGV